MANTKGLLSETKTRLCYKKIRFCFGPTSTYSRVRHDSEPRCCWPLRSIRSIVESLVQVVRHYLEDQDEDDEHREVNKRVEDRFTVVSALDEVVRVRERRNIGDHLPKGGEYGERNEDAGYEDQWKPHEVYHGDDISGALSRICRKERGHRRKAE